MRHDKIRDSMAEILSYAGVKGVETERLLQPCDDFADRLPHWKNQDRDARMDIVGSGFLPLHLLCYGDCLDYQLHLGIARQMNAIGFICYRPR